MKNRKVLKFLHGINHPWTFPVSLDTCSVLHPKQIVLWVCLLHLVINERINDTVSPNKHGIYGREYWIVNAQYLLISTKFGLVDLMINTQKHYERSPTVEIPWKIYCNTDCVQCTLYNNYLNLDRLDRLNCSCFDLGYTWA